MDDEAETLFLELADLPPEHAVPALRPANRNASVRLVRITRDRWLLLSTLEDRQDQKGPVSAEIRKWLERFQRTPLGGSASDPRGKTRRTRVSGFSTHASHSAVICGIRLQPCLPR